MSISIPNVVVKRLKSATPRYRDILKKKIEEDLNEADTVTIITDMLEKVFGFDKIEDIRKEFRIQGNYKCDIAVMLKKKVAYLIEVKSIGSTLSNKHIKQAVTYASREGIDNVVLTNGILWQVYRVTLQDKVQNELMFEIDFLNLNLKSKEDLERLFLLCNRGVQRSAIDGFYEHSQVFNKYTLGRLLLTDPVLNVVRREMRKLKDGMRQISLDQIQEKLEQEVIKRDLLGEDGEDAKKLIAKASRKQKKVSARKTAESADENTDGSTLADETDIDTQQQDGG